jgi:hypothetical protein
VGQMPFDVAKSRVGVGFKHWVLISNATRDRDVSSSDLQNVCNNGTNFITKFFCWTLHVVLSMVQLYNVSGPGSDSFIRCKRGKFLLGSVH